MPAMKAQMLCGAALPPGLRDLPEPPEWLFVHGRLPRGPCVGIVGTREPSEEARDYAVQLAFRLAERGVAVISGGAEGIDAAAHEGALEARGVTVVVAPSSFEHPYPAEHRELFSDIVARGGAHLSAFDVGVAPRRHQFFLRNSILAAISHCLIIVEAPLRSGARNAASWARQLQRTCFIVPAAPWNPRGLGNIAELQLGGRALASPEEVLRWLDERQLHAVSVPLPEPDAGAGEPASPVAAPLPMPMAGGRRSRARARPSGSAGSSTLEEAILSALKAGARHPDEICHVASLSAAEVSHGALLLVLKGQVRQAEGGELTIIR
jgi:DNA processing protein